MRPQRPRKRFGQHFLTDVAVIDAIVATIGAQADEVIVEIGPGRGAITAALAAGAGHLHCVELDRDLAAALRERYASRDNVTIHQADALRFDFASLGTALRVVGNLPYNISTPLLFHLLEYRECITDMLFMLQKEVVERMAAVPGTKAYGRLGIMLGCHLGVQPLFDVDARAFDPPPAVSSAVVRLEPLPAGSFDIDDEALLSRVVATAFSQRRKTLRNALRSLLDDAEWPALGIDPRMRPEMLAIGDYVKLANYVARRGAESG